MRSPLLFLISFLFIINLSAQKEKIKGNKIVTTERREVPDFHTIELYDNFQFTLDTDNGNTIKVETDSNLQNSIKVEVLDSILTIRTTKNIKRAKKLNIDILYSSKLKKIILHDKVEIKSLSPIQSSVLHIETADDSEATLTIDADKLNFSSSGKSNTNLQVTSQKTILDVTENSNVKGAISCDDSTINLYQKGTLKLEGDLSTLTLTVDDNTNFYGEKLAVKNTKLIAEGSSDCFVLTTDKITISAKEKTEIYILGDPKIKLDKFSDESIIYKKDIDYSPSRIRL